MVALAPGLCFYIVRSRHRPQRRLSTVEQSGYVVLVSTLCLAVAALVFALLRVSPTPFCVLDEVDAMLDEANVGRYRDMLLDLSSATQFIIVTHNPNLVVNTDADQVIVATSVRRERGKLPEISYTSGALEDPAIRDAVCEILEGGAEAFRQRERRYGLAVPPAATR